MLRKRMYREAGSVAALITRSGLRIDQREVTFPIMTLAQMGRTLDSRYPTDSPALRVQAASPAVGGTGLAYLNGFSSCGRSASAPACAAGIRRASLPAHRSRNRRARSQSRYLPPPRRDGR